ncbi:MAG: Asp23/Gls24 family envelope stress response protein [Clostridia bacterium]|nr:Asp23/Gls24 family envelope stress response protein [Clostridia bacterium]
MENNINAEVFENNGTVNISDEVVAVIASLAASEVKGVVGMVSNMASGIAELLGKKNLSKGVKITKDEAGVKLDLSIIVEYGAKIPDVAWDVQDKVKNEVESMTGLDIAAVNVSVDSVNVPVTETAKPVKEEAEEVQAEETADAE